MPGTTLKYTTACSFLILTYSPFHPTRHYVICGAEVLLLSKLLKARRTRIISISLLGRLFYDVLSVVEVKFV
jgi:hypothetical protein